MLTLNRVRADAAGPDEDEALVARLRPHWLTLLLTTSPSTDPPAYACPNALAARAIPVMITELRRFGITGEVLLRNEACRYGRVGEAEDKAGPKVNVG